MSNVAVVTQVIEQLVWNSDGIALLMMRNNIPSRAALAKELGMPRNSICRAFNKQWEGHAPDHLIAVMCSYFRVRISDIVVEPVMALRRLEMEQRVSL